jgi:hypothetical protein
VISGHFHTPSARRIGGTLFLRIGSTGGAGANVFTTEAGIPLSAEILHFRPAQGDQLAALVAWDEVTESPVSGDLTIERHTVDQALEPLPAPTASVTPS